MSQVRRALLRLVGRTGVARQRDARPRRSALLRVPPAARPRQGAAGGWAAVLASELQVSCRWVGSTRSALVLGWSATACLVPPADHLLASPHLASPPSLSPPIRLQTAVSHGHVGPTLRQSCPSLYWNLLLWLLSFALPTATLAHLGRVDDGGGSVDDDVDGLGLSALSARSTSQLPVPVGAGAGAALRAEAAELVMRIPSAAARSAVAAAATMRPASIGPPLVAA